MSSRRIPPVGRPVSIASALTLAVIAGTAGFLLGRFPSLPIFLPVRFGRGGMATRWQLKSLAFVLTPVWVQLLLAAVFGTVALVLLWNARPSDATDGSGADARRMTAAAEAVSLLAFVWISLQAMGAVQLVWLWQRGWGGGVDTAYTTAVVAAAIVSGIIAIRAMAAVAGTPARAAGSIDGAHWRFNALYVNRNDPALFVPSRSGAGWTVNFGRPAAVALMVLALLVGVGAPILLVTVLTR